jgi:hypothetical protein
MALGCLNLSRGQVFPIVYDEEQQNCVVKGSPYFNVHLIMQGN